jgi:hypothetical protein
MKKINNTQLTNSLPIPASLIERRIYLIRGQEVMLDSDLAELYQIQTKAMNRAVRRNIERFPKDFMFQLTEIENKSLRCQIGTSNEGRGGRRTLAYAFTEHGVAMLSSVLHSNRAILMNIYIIRAFIQLRKILLEHKELSNRLKKVEGTVKFHGEILMSVAKDIKKIKNPPKTNAIGFEWKK